ncbi:MAG: hypothetical protein ACYDEX_08145 [Mobilitalea sp.]
MNDTVFDIPSNQWGAAQIFEFIITYALPIVATIAVIIGGLWTVYKYFNEKNREFYSDILENVYSPLFNELVKNEYSRKIIMDSNESDEAKSEFSVDKLPFITWKGVKTNTKMTIGKTEVHQEEYNVFNIDEILNEIHNNNQRLKYAPRDLVALIESYFFLEKVTGAPPYEGERIKIQKMIRQNIIIGYKKYRKKLGLKDVSAFKFCYSWFGFIWFK